MRGRILHAARGRVAACRTRWKESALWKGSAEKEFCMQPSERCMRGNGHLDQGLRKDCLETQQSVARRNYTDPHLNGNQGSLNCLGHLQLDL